MSSLQDNNKSSEDATSASNGSDKQIQDSESRQTSNTISLSLSSIPTHKERTQPIVNISSLATKTTNNIFSGAPNQKSSFSIAPQNAFQQSFSNRPPASFAELAESNRSSNVANSLSAQIACHTLSEYGPIVDNSRTKSMTNDAPIAPPTYIAQPVISNDPMGPIIISSERDPSCLDGTTNPTTMTSSGPLTSSQPIVTQPPASLIIPDSGLQVPTPGDGLLYSPPASRSTLPDHLNNPNINPNTGRPFIEGQIRGKIPKKSNDQQADDIINNMSMLELKTAYREYEVDLKKAKILRDNILREINVMQRNSKGRNIENDPIFLRSKDEQRKTDKDAELIRDKMKKIENRLYVDFGYRISRTDSGKKSGSIPQMQSNMRRARMSTTSTREPARVESGKDKSTKKVLFDLKDTNTYCKDCDVHPNSLREYSKHIHSHDHLRNVKKITPWRSNNNVGDQIDRKRSYDLMKSICAKLSNELDRNFKILDVDGIFNPSLSNKEKELKERLVSRERGKFSEDDDLFKIRGYDYIVPITGYYCILCSKPLCDYLEFEQHIKSYEHVYAHFKSIALNPRHESELRKEWEKSYKQQFPPVESEVIATAPKTDTEGRTKSSTDTRITSYKKLTSRIVDEHESIADKFPDRSATRTTSATNKETRSSDSESEHLPKSKSKLGSPRKRKIDDGFEIRPLGQHKPTALKRLRTTISDFKRPRSKSSSSSSDSDESDEEEIIDIGQDINTGTTRGFHLGIGHVDNPLPQYKISVGGNVHENVLKDKRLAMPIEIKLTKINLDDYKDLLLDSSTLWTRINCLMTKREKVGNLQDDNISRVQTAPTYFTTGGNQVPIEFDKNGEVIKVKTEPKGKSPKKGGSPKKTTAQKKNDLPLASQDDKKQEKKNLTSQDPLKDHELEINLDEESIGKALATNDANRAKLFDDSDGDEKGDGQDNSFTNYMNVLNDFFVEK